jgi:6-oxo-cyclohex-1-ene-carbonyl-CoA hydrolase
LRKPKLDAWNRNKENSRAWLALNMMTEARAGFRAFNEGTKDTGREVDFVALRRALAANNKWDDALTEDILPGAAQRRLIATSLPWSAGASATAR